MAVLSITQSYTITIDGQTYTGGSTTADTVTLSGETIFDRTYSITGGVLTEIFRAGSAATDDLADWGFMFIQSDVVGQIRIMTNEGGTAGTDQHGFILSVAAGIPLMLTGGDVSRGEAAGASGTVGDLAFDWTNEAASVIDTVEFDATLTAKVRIVAIR